MEWLIIASDHILGSIIGKIFKIICIFVENMLIKGDLQSWLKISLVIYFLSEIYFEYIYIGKWKVKVYTYVNINEKTLVAILI